MIISKEEMPRGPWRIAGYQPKLGLYIRPREYETLEEAMGEYAMEDSSAVFLAVTNPEIALCQNISTVLVDNAGFCYQPIFEKTTLCGFMLMELSLDSKGYLKH